MNFFTIRNEVLNEAVKNAYQIIFESNDNKITLFRGLTQKIDHSYRLDKTDAPYGYSTWTTNPLLARAYAGPDGYVYQMTVPSNYVSTEYIDNDGERSFVYKTEKSAGLVDPEYTENTHTKHVIQGDEYLVYHFHDLYDPADITLSSY